MKPGAHRWTALFLLCLIGIFSWSGRGVADETRPFVVVVSNSPPFRLVEQWNGSGQYSGVFIDAITMVSERTGVKLELKAASYSQALTMIGNGDADMMLGAKWTPQQTLFMDYLGTWFPAEPNVFFLARTQKDLWRYGDLARLKIGVLKAAKYFDPFDQDQTLRKTEFESYEKAFAALDRKEIDVVLSPQRQGLYRLKQLGLAFKIATYHDPGVPTYVTISKRSPLLKKRSLMEGALMEMRRERYFERLLEIYDF